MRICRRIPNVAIPCALLALALLAGSGCALRRPEPPREVFGFAPEVPKLPAPSNGPVLAVRLIESAPMFENQSFVYRTGEFDWTSDFYRIFGNSPSAQITTITRRWLADSGIFSAVSIPGLSPGNSWHLEGFVEELFVDFRDPGEPEAVLTIRFALYSPRAAELNEMLFFKRYAARKPVSGRGGGDIMRAWDKALAEILTSLVKDLAGRDWTVPKPGTGGSAADPDSRHPTGGGDKYKPVPVTELTERLEKRAKP